MLLQRMGKEGIRFPCSLLLSGKNHSSLMWSHHVLRKQSRDFLAGTTKNDFLVAMAEVTAWPAGARQLEGEIVINQQYMGLSKCSFKTATGF